jgi:replication factor C small subunit
MADKLGKPWVEKFRPKTLNDVVNQKEIISRLHQFVKDKSMPHLIFAGPAGTGKTTCALSMVREIYSKKMIPNVTYLELNASDERGIDVIRTIIKDFAKARPPIEFPFKILILDEADNMTAPAQQALRRTMEKYTKNCRMILICNYSNKLILPIQSRAVVFRFSKLSSEDIVERLSFIADKEKIKIDESGLNALVNVSMGDLRRAINYLQSSSTLSDEINEEIIFRIAGEVPSNEIKNILKFSIKGELKLAKSILDNLVREYGLSGSNLIRQMHREIYNLDISEDQKIEIIKILAEIEYRLTQGGTEEIQLNALLAKIVLLSL